MSETTANIKKENGNILMFNDTMVATTKNTTDELDTTIRSNLVFRSIAGATGSFDVRENVIELTLRGKDLERTLVFKDFHFLPPDKAREYVKEPAEGIVSGKRGKVKNI